MCTYVTQTIPASGSAKGPEGWFSISQATIYFDHPFHAPLEHSLNVDFADPIHPCRRVAVELSASSARALADAILAVVDAGQASVQPLG